ncbi:hypothetical protein P4S73_03950 [Paraglaciecola sp. Hal342]
MNTFKHLSTQCLTITPSNKALTLVEVDSNATLRKSTNSLPLCYLDDTNGTTMQRVLSGQLLIEYAGFGVLASDTSTQEHTISAASSDNSETNAPQPRLEKTFLMGRLHRVCLAWGNTVSIFQTVMNERKRFSIKLLL